ncbi:MAG TPA: hypothetical protein VL358_09780 [Caulobacteraceae bacterium]|jgi:hypothetical protein|nr:hypothetical protein [Caulobacteraceae bacterium]
MDIEHRIGTLERRQRRVVIALCLAVVALASLAGYQATAIRALQTATSLRLKELRIADDKGVDRVIISGRLPNLIYEGKPVPGPPRAMAGMLIYDGSGAERGGYGTADGYANALLTLDSKDAQEFLLLAEPGGGALFREWQGDNSVTLAADDKPSLTLKAGKDVVFAMPQGNEWVTKTLH